MEDTKQVMMRHQSISLERLEKFVSDTYFKDTNIRGKVYPLNNSNNVSLEVFHAPGRISHEEAMKGEYVGCKVGDSFGPSWTTHWFKVQVDIPTQWKGEEVRFLWNAGCEGCIWQNGVPIQGLTGGTWNDKRTEFRLAKSAKGGEHFAFEIELACNGMFGTGKDGLINPPDPDKTFSLSQAEVSVFDAEAYGLLFDIIILWEIAKELKEGSHRGARALYIANKMVNLCNTADRSTWPAARKLAKEFFSQKNADSQHNVSAIGHCHIDVAWLWPYAETRRKSARSWATQVLYMDDYPEYKFAQSQAQLYEWVKKDYPPLYEKIRAKVKSGQFIPTGGTWVEMDGNMPSGESFVRQFLFGQRFFQKEFGITCSEFWLPDTFGYSAQLPQVVRHSGISNFMTQKLSWNNINKFPHSTFIWEGIDEVKELIGSSKDCKDNDRCNESLLVFGHGDGGGGPNIEMLERLRRVPDVDGIPRVHQRTPSEFFKRCEPFADELLTWVGELYFELHRGTYTSQARTKKGNRKSEFHLHDAEFLAYLAYVYKNVPYPEEINEMWKLVLLNQFHDVLPGSSIGMVYDDTVEYYAKVAETATRLVNHTLSALIGSGNSSPTDSVVAINTTSFARHELVELPENQNSCQISHGGKPLAIVSVPAYGLQQHAVAQITQKPAQEVTLTPNSDGFILENQYVRVVVAGDGTLHSIFDKTLNREAIEKGKKGNRFVLYDDVPLFWDAWDVEIYSLEKAYQIGQGKVRALENGPLRAAVEVVYDTLTSNSKLYQVEFPTTIRSPVATYEIQFGHIQRPTHYNTSWDMARFEVCGHKWGDLSEHGFGVALLNDCKYGYAANKNILRLSLLRSPKAPDGNCDMGSHTFRYSIFTHSGNLQQSGVISQAYGLNVPLRVLPLPTGGRVPFDGASIIKASTPSVVIETVKKEEDGSGMIVRAYESFGGTARFHIESVLPVKQVHRCNGLEVTESAVKWNDGKSEELVLTPFQIISLKFTI